MPARRQQTGALGLEGQLLRVYCATQAIRARRAVPERLQTLHELFCNREALRAESRRLFGWFKERGLAVVLTAERGDAGWTRSGFEDYAADCVIAPDHRIVAEVATRRIRLVKYHGSRHGTDDAPRRIDGRGPAAVPITSVALDHAVSDERGRIGVPELDRLRGGGVFPASPQSSSGGPGTGKSTRGARAVDASCRRGERSLSLAFEESAAQIVRRTRSGGLDLERWRAQFDREPRALKARHDSASEKAERE